MNNTETKTNIDVTPREAALPLLTNPKAKLSNKARKACRTMLDRSAVSSQEAGFDRASRRRVAKDLARPDAPQPKPCKDGEAKFEAKLARKSAAQLGRIIRRGNYRGRFFMRQAAAAVTLKMQNRLGLVADACLKTAQRATTHYRNRVHPKAITHYRNRVNLCVVK